MENKTTRELILNEFTKRVWSRTEENEDKYHKSMLKSLGIFDNLLLDIISNSLWYIITDYLLFDWPRHVICTSSIPNSIPLCVNCVFHSDIANDNEHIIKIYLRRRFASEPGDHDDYTGLVYALCKKCFESDKSGFNMTIDETGLKDEIETPLKSMSQQFQDHCVWLGIIYFDFVIMYRIKLKGRNADVIKYST